MLFSIFVREKVTITENVNITDHASGIQLPDCSKLTINRENDNDVTNCWHDIILNFFDVAVFFLPKLVTGPSFISISILVFS